MNQGGMIERVIVAGGGTGGHLFPGIALVEELRRRQPDVQVLFVGTKKGIEARVLPERGERLELIDVAPLKGRTLGQRMRSLMMLPGAFSRASSLVKEFRPDLVLGVGGYASGPMLLAAAARGVKTALLEQNAYVGMTNRLLVPIAGRAYVAFVEAAEQIGARRARLLGNPVRRAFVEASRSAQADPEGFEARSKTIFVLGGSQGARALNETVPTAMANLDLEARGLRVLHQTGSAMRDDVAARYAELGVDAEVVSFVDDMATAYARASIVIARAGATTLAEVCAIGRPSILVPYPHAADDHQAKNADALARVGAAISILETELDEERLTAQVRALLDDQAARLDMAGAARAHGKPDAAAAIVDDLGSWFGVSWAEPCDEDAEAGAASTADDDDGFRFAVVDFRARRGLEIQARQKSTNPPPPAYLQLAPPLMGPKVAGPKRA